VGVLVLSFVRWEPLRLGRRCCSRRSWGIHDHGDAEETDDGADEVVAIGPKPIEHDTPEQGTGDEHPAVGGEDAPEVGSGCRVATNP
jgi:hypothetical protein